jgi:hypothetical protein
MEKSKEYIRGWNDAIRKAAQIMQYAIDDGECLYDAMEEVETRVIVVDKDGWIK